MYTCIEMSTLPSMSSKFLSNSFARASDKSKCNHKLNLQSMKIDWEAKQLGHCFKAFATETIHAALSLNLRNFKKFKNYKEIAKKLKTNSTLK